MPIDSMYSVKTPEEQTKLIDVLSDDHSILSERRRAAQWLRPRPGGMNKSMH